MSDTLKPLTMSTKVLLLPPELKAIGDLAEMVRDYWSVDKHPQNPADWLVMAAALTAFPEMAHTRESCGCLDAADCDECLPQSAVEKTVTTFKQFMAMGQEQRDGFLRRMNANLFKRATDPLSPVLPGV